MTRKTSSILGLGFPVVITFVNGVSPLPQEMIEARCSGAYQIRCAAGVPRPLNAPAFPEYRSDMATLTSSATATPVVAAVTFNFEG